jgi:quinol monooxygenase YgiN
MNNIRMLAILKIHHDKLKEFKELLIQCIDTIKAHEPGTIRFDCFFNADETECVVQEEYNDSASVFAHFSNAGLLVGRLLQFSNMTLEVFGDPSKELKERLAGSNPAIYSFYKGL